MKLSCKICTDKAKKQNEDAQTVYHDKSEFWEAQMYSRGYYASCKAEISARNNKYQQARKEQAKQDGIKRYKRTMMEYVQDPDWPIRVENQMSPLNFKFAQEDRMS